MSSFSDLHLKSVLEKKEIVDMQAATKISSCCEKGL